MFEPFLNLPSADWLRLSLLYAHLLLCAIALAGVLQADIRIASGRFTVRGLRRLAHQTSLVLVALWLSGLSIVYLDTGLDPDVLARTPKLLLKLVTVTVLSANGVLLHLFSFPVIASRVRPTLPQALLLAVTGALSTSHWLLAAFVGVARPLGQWPLETLLFCYAAYTGMTLLVAMASVPALRYRLTGARRFAPEPV